MEGQRSNAGDECETSDSFGVPDVDNEKTCEKEARRFRVVVLEKSTESIVDGKKEIISIIENIKPEWKLDSRVTKAALSYFGHVVSAGGMEDDVMLGRMNGVRKRGRPRQKWLDKFKGYSSGATISNMRRDARNRAGWRGAAMTVTRGRMRLDGTRLRRFIELHYWARLGNGSISLSCPVFPLSKNLVCICPTQRQ